MKKSKRAKSKGAGGYDDEDCKELSLAKYLNLRYISLVTLTLQTTTIITLYCYSRIHLSDGVQYLSSTVVVLAEVLKMIFCLLVFYKDTGSIFKTLSTIKDEIFYKPLELVKVLVPASLYALQNNLAFYALTNLDPASYQVAYQMKILFTAMFSVLIVNKQISKVQWLSLILLFSGISLVEYPGDDATHSFNPGNDERNRLLGLIAVVACCLSSGFSGVYFERLIKFKPNQSLWVRNFQLALLCCLMSTLGMVYQDLGAIRANGLFQGYNTLTWIIVLLQTFGGLIVATVVKHADNVLKGFATSISIILSTLLSYYLFEDFRPSSSFYLGASTVIISTIMYNSNL